MHHYFNYRLGFVDGGAGSANKDVEVRKGLGIPNRDWELELGFAPAATFPTMVVGGQTFPTGPKVPETEGVPR